MNPVRERVLETLGAELRARIERAEAAIAAAFADAYLGGARPVYGPPERPRMAIAAPLRPRIVGHRWYVETPWAIRKRDAVQVVADAFEVELARKKDERRFAARGRA